MLRVAILVSVLVSGCGDNLTESPPDADVDAAPDCCLLWPDVNAISACMKPPPKSCGRARCETPDGWVDIPVCGPPG